MPKAYCPRCAARCSVKPEMFAKRVVCPNCGSRFVPADVWRKRMLVYGAGVVGVTAVAVIGMCLALASDGPGRAAKTHAISPPVEVFTTPDTSLNPDPNPFPDGILLDRP